MSLMNNYSHVVGFTEIGRFSGQDEGNGRVNSYFDSFQVLRYVAGSLAVFFRLYYVATPLLADAREAIVCDSVDVTTRTFVPLGLTVGHSNSLKSEPRSKSINKNSGVIRRALLHTVSNSNRAMLIIMYYNRIITNILTRNRTMNKSSSNRIALILSDLDRNRLRAIITSVIR